MVQEYSDNMYEPAAAAATRLGTNGAAKAREVSAWKKEIRLLWPQVRINDVKIVNQSINVLVGDALAVEARVHLGDISPKFVRVQVYVGETSDNEIARPIAVDLSECKKDAHGDYIYQGSVQAPESGAYGFNVRVIPTHPSLTQPHELRLITWAS